MLHLQNISFGFGGDYLFKDVDWFIKPKERIGLVGKNGAGKSTLLKLITGELELREGSINKQSGLKLGYLSQDMISDREDLSVLETALLAFSEELKIKKEIDRLLELVEIDHSEENIHRLSDLQEEFARLDGYTMESKSAEVLEGLGFKTSDLDRPLGEFSGGWRMRVILARMLLEQPDLMLLDEPTNHLDLPSIQWIESYLSNYPGTVVIISHDREFLNRMTTKIAELSHQQLFLWSGNYDFYLQAKIERDDLMQRKLENQKQFIKDQEKFINRFRYKASKAKAVQSRIKMLDKIDKLDELPSDGAHMNIRFKVKQASGKQVMEFKSIGKSYGEQEIFKDVDIDINRGDKIALIGANGTGKSTFLRIIANQESFKGSRKEGHNVDASFYAQHQLECLNLNNEILDELKEHAPDQSETDLRGVLGCFLFSGEDVFKPIKVLSGGEKARVALAKTLVSESNFLLLDEPTNHLDIDSIEILIEALRNYEGTLIFVSHNRYFISKLANKVWWIENKDVKSYPGTFDEYITSKGEIKEIKNAPIEKSTQRSKKNWKQSDDSEKQLKKLNKELHTLEAQLEQVKGRRSEIEAQLLETAATDQDAFMALSKAMKENEQESARLEEQCEQILEKIIELEV